MKVKAIALMLSCAAAFSAAAQDSQGSVDGYFRVKNGNGQYMAVTGTFTANAKLDATATKSEPGSVFHITAEHADEYTYRLDNLGAQGIDLAKETWEGSYSDLLGGALNESDGLNISAIWGLVHQGYRYGYTSVCRATLATVFELVAGKLADKNANVPGHTPGSGVCTLDEFETVTKDFNDNVVANLDLGLKMVRPGEGNYYNIYVDMPDFGKVVEWYAQEPNHTHFFHATQAMAMYLMDKKDAADLAADEVTGAFKLPLFSDDLKILDKFGYDYTKDLEVINVSELPENLKAQLPADYKNEDRVAIYTFDQVFSNKELCFNWVKLMAYCIMYPGETGNGIMSKITNRLSGVDIAGLMKEHTITRYLYEQIPAFQADSKVYFIAGNVVDGVYNGENHLGFAIDADDLAVAGVNGLWEIENIENDYVTVALDKTIDGGKYASCFFDFPVKAAAGTKFYTLSEEKTEGEYTYVTLEEIAEGKVPAGDPFFVGADAAEVSLLIDYTSHFDELPVYVPVEEPTGFVVSDEEVAKQYAPARRVSTVKNNNFRGTYLATQMDYIKGYLEIKDTDLNALTFGEQKVEGYTGKVVADGTEKVAFVDADGNVVYTADAVAGKEYDGVITPLADNYFGFSNDKALAATAANNVVYTSEADVIYIGKPEFKKELSQLYVPEDPVEMDPIDGYFRIINGNKNYMAVTGTFTANANVYDPSEMPGSIFKVVADRSGHLSNLGAQGIDLAKETWEGDYSELLEGALENGGGLDIKTIWGLVHQGYRYGYTSICRATLATVFKLVAERLAGKGEGVPGHGTEFGCSADEFESVTTDFNNQVVPNLDLGLKMAPIAGGAYNIYVDMPDFGLVADWYGKEENHTRFLHATQAMAMYLMDKKDATGLATDEVTGAFKLPLFSDDLKILDKFGYDYTKDLEVINVSELPENLKEQLPADYRNEDRVAIYTFDQVFSSKELCFNWVKLMAYCIMYPGETGNGIMSKITNRLSGVDIAGLMKEHTITRYLYEQMPAFQADSKVYFIAGNVVDGVHNGENHLGFAVDKAALNVAGANANWTIEPIGEEAIEIELLDKYELTDPDLQGMKFASCYFDFPVKANDGAKLYTLSEEKNDFYLENDTVMMYYPYVEFVEIQKAEAGQPFFVGAKDVDGVTLAIDYTPAAVAAVAQPNEHLRGTFLATSTENLKHYWGLEAEPVLHTLGVQNIEPFTASKVAEGGEDVVDWDENGNEITISGEAGVTYSMVLNAAADYHGFAVDDKATATKANSVVYAKAIAPARAIRRAAGEKEVATAPYTLLGQPEFKESLQTGVANVGVDVEAPAEFFNLQGIQVANPEAGHIYIIRRGNKVSKAYIQ